MGDENDSDEGSRELVVGTILTGNRTMCESALGPLRIRCFANVRRRETLSARDPAPNDLFDECEVSVSAEHREQREKRLRSVVVVVAAAAAVAALRSQTFRRN